MNLPSDPRSPGIEIADPAAYRAKLIALVGERDPIDVLGATPGELSAIVIHYDDARLSARPADGAWSVREVIGHLVDAEWVFGWRIRTIWCDDSPAIMGMDQHRWVDTQTHNARPAGELIEDLAALRRINVRLWRSIPAAAMGRSGTHAERGPESLADMLPLHAGHDLAHLAQVRRTLAAVAPSE